MRKGKVTVFSAPDGTVKLVRCKFGRKKKEFRPIEFARPEQMAEAVSAWLKKHKVVHVEGEEADLSPQQQLQECLLEQQLFHDAIFVIADEIEFQNATSWDDMSASALEVVMVHRSRSEALFERLKAVFTPQQFLSLARCPDDEEWDGTGPLNPGLNTIKDALFGNTRSDRMRWISLSE